MLLFLAIPTLGLLLARATPTAPPPTHVNTPPGTVPPSSNTSTPSLIPILRASGGDKKPNSYIVTLNTGVSRSQFLKTLNAEFSKFNDTDVQDKVVYGGWNEKILNGFSGTFGTKALAALQSSRDVKAIEEDGIMRGQVVSQQTNAGWNLQRIVQPGQITGGPGSFKYVYSYDSSAGQGVDIYIVDTGVMTTHSEFGGRARFGAAFPGSSTADGHGHGTHCAGVAASGRYGVAKRAGIIAVKVLNDQSAGATSDVISGLNYVGESAQDSGRPSVASVSLGGGLSEALDTAAGNLVDQGVHVVAAAGNDNVDASNVSPARSEKVIAVGASDIRDIRATYSNYGDVVDIFAPGTQITSTWIKGDQSTAVLSGTSAATPHVAGAIAYLLGVHGYVTPSDMAAYLRSTVTSDALSSIPEGTRNDLLRIQMPS